MTARRIDHGLSRPAPVRIVVDGSDVQAVPGESLAAALLVAGRRALRASPRHEAPRGAFCMMGVCQECVVEVNGRRRQACLVPVEAGLVVRTGWPADG